MTRGTGHHGTGIRGTGTDGIGILGTTGRTGADGIILTGITTIADGMTDITAEVSGTAEGISITGPGTRQVHTGQGHHPCQEIPYQGMPQALQYPGPQGHPGYRAAQRQGSGRSAGPYLHPEEAVSAGAYRHQPHGEQAAYLALQGQSPGHQGRFPGHQEQCQDHQAQSHGLPGQSQDPPVR